MTNPTYILGLNAYHGDSAACLVKDGVLVAAIEEERIRRIKHWAGLPTEAIRYCLASAGISLAEVSAIAIARDPYARMPQKLLRVLRRGFTFSFLRSRAKNLTKVRGLREELARGLGVPIGSVPTRVVNVEHHRAHLASSFLVSPFEQAAAVSVDGFGDFASTMIGVGVGNRIETKEAVTFPHSLGLFYTALTQFLGFPNYGDEYKVMGLSAFGTPKYRDQIRKLVHIDPHGLFRLDTSYFRHDSEGVEMTWLDGAPTIGRLFSDKLITLLGAPRAAEAPVTEREKDLAASVQAVYEEAFFHVLNRAYEMTNVPALALAGGCAQNSLANGKIYQRTPFTEVYIPPAAHDAGGAIGAAMHAWHEVMGRPRSYVMTSPFWGPSYDDAAYESALTAAKLAYRKLPDAELFAMVAEWLADGKIAGWFQGRTEWGPRALGNRSILANPARKDMKEILNAKIKRRESFRPFAPSVLEEAVGEYFEESHPVPFMEKVYMIRAEKRALLPAVTHEDGTGRLQTVSRAVNPRYYDLIAAFRDRTGVPMLLNTSFNENEPIVNRPEEAIDCFRRTKMDLLVLGNYVVERTS